MPRGGWSIRTDPRGPYCQPGVLGYTERDKQQITICGPQDPEVLIHEALHAAEVDKGHLYEPDGEEQAVRHAARETISMANAFRIPGLGRRERARTEAQKALTELKSHPAALPAVVVAMHSFLMGWDALDILRGDNDEAAIQMEGQLWYYLTVAESNPDLKDLAGALRHILEGGR